MEYLTSYGDFIIEGIKEVIVELSESFLTVLFSTGRAALILFVAFSFFTVIFNNHKMVKNVPLFIGIYILLMVVKEWIGLV